MQSLGTASRMAIRVCVGRCLASKPRHTHGPLPPFLYCPALRSCSRRCHDTPLGTAAAATSSTPAAPSTSLAPGPVASLTFGAPLPATASATAIVPAVAAGPPPTPNSRLRSRATTWRRSSTTGAASWSGSRARSSSTQVGLGGCSVRPLCACVGNGGLSGQLLLRHTTHARCSARSSSTQVGLALGCVCVASYVGKREDAGPDWFGGTL